MARRRQDLSSRRAPARAGETLLVGHGLRRQTRSEIKTDQDKAALRSLFELKGDPKGAPLTLTFGPKAPESQEDRWIKTIPGRGWFAYFRIYGPETAAFDKSWKPGDFEEAQ